MKTLIEKLIKKVEEKTGEKIEFINLHKRDVKFWKQKVKGMRK
jgi:hypothetical protein